MINEAIILAGGAGTRLKKVVPDKPKPMALINNKPFLEYLLNYLSRNGITNVILSVGFLAESIQNHFGNIYGDIKISYALETEPLGTGGGIKYALEKVRSSHVFILNGDTMFEIDLKQLYIFHKKNNSELSMALKAVGNAARYGTISIDPSKRIVDFKEKNENSKNALINGGIYLMAKSAFEKDVFPVKFSFEKDYLEKYYREKRFFGMIFNDYFIDIGVPETYKKAQTDFVNVFGESKK